MSKYKDKISSKIPTESGHNIRGRVGAKFGRKQDDPHERAISHHSVPIEQLRDPSSFAPPPKRSGTGLLPPPPPTAAGKRKVVQAPSKWQDPRGPAVAPPEKVSTDPELEAYYAEHNPEMLHHGNGGQLLLEGPETDEGPRQYSVNTTGLSTDHLPGPPRRRDGADGRSPPPYEAPGQQRPPALPPVARPASNGPPKLPSRMGTRSPPKSSTETTKNGGLNQGAMNRLGAAGVSVPSLGIGSISSASPAPPPPPRTPSRQQAPSQPAHMNALQDRFAKMSSTQNTDVGSEPAAPSSGTTWQQKQAALKTASQFHKDPSSVSFSDARAAAGTANNFRQRHGEQAAAVWSKANQLSDKNSVANKFGGYSASGSNGQEDATSGNDGITSAVVAAAGKKKPPPPPTKRKPARFEVTEPPVQDNDTPPPVPLATRPTF